MLRSSRAKVGNRGSGLLVRISQGFRGSGFKGLGFRGLGFRVNPRKLEHGFRRISARIPNTLP